MPDGGRPPRVGKPDDGGCGCRVASPARGTLWQLMFAAFGLAFFARRRRNAR